MSHLDITMRGCTVTVDGIAAVIDGALVEPEPRQRAP